MKKCNRTITWEKSHKMQLEVAVIAAILLHIILLYSVRTDAKVKAEWKKPSPVTSMLVLKLPPEEPTPEPKSTPPRRINVPETSRAYLRPPPEQIPVPVPENMISDPSISEPVYNDFTDIDLPEMEPPSNMPYQLGNPEITPPVCIHKVKPIYPKLVNRLGLHGTTKLSCVISNQGIPENIEVTQSFNGACDKAAIAAVAQWRYTPATLNDTPISVIMHLAVTFVSH